MDLDVVNIFDEDLFPSMSNKPYSDPLSSTLDFLNSDVQQSKKNQCLCIIRQSDALLVIGLGEAKGNWIWRILNQSIQQSDSISLGRKMIKQQNFRI